MLGPWCSPRSTCAPDLPLVIGAEQRRRIVAEGRLAVVRISVSAAERLRSAAEDARRAVEAARRRQIACARVVLSRVDEAAHANVPHGIGGQGVRQVAEGDGRHRCACGRRVASNGVTNVGCSGLTQNSSCTLCTNCQPGASLPRELREDLVLLVGPGELPDRCPAGCRSRADAGIPRRTTADREPPDRRCSS